jgi:hypothetical protein
VDISLPRSAAARYAPYKIEQILGLYDLALAVKPLLGLYDVKLRALLGQKAGYDPRSFGAVFDMAIVGAEPTSDLHGDVPARVVPDEKQYLLAELFELLSALWETLSRYGTHGPTVHEPDLRLVELRHRISLTGDSVGVGIVFGD